MLAMTFRCVFAFASSTPHRYLYKTETVAQQDDIIKDLEQPVVATKIDALKQAILLLLSGEAMPR